MPLPISRPGAGRTFKCKYCGAPNLRWDKTGVDANGKPQWRPYDYKAGKHHDCDVYREHLANIFNKPPQPTQSSTYEEAEDKPEWHDDPKADFETSSKPGESLGKTHVLAKLSELSIKLNALEAARESDSQATTSVLAALSQQMLELKSQVNQTQTIEIKRPDNVIVNVGVQHKSFPDLIAYASLREHVLMVGPAGSGKTTAAHNCAQALGLTYYEISMGPALTESRLIGYPDANGRVFRTLFREAYEHGGIFMADEMDNSNASALTVLNSALANGECSFPDGMVKRHTDFVFLGGANTYGRGADRVYVGRQQLDGATLNRFLILNWDYDSDLEFALANNPEWVGFVQNVRQTAANHSLRVLVTPRASIKGAKMLAAGIERQKVEQVLIWSHMPQDAVTTIKNSLNINQ